MMLFFPEFINSDCPILSGLVYHFQKGIYSFHPTNHTVRGREEGAGKLRNSEVNLMWVVGGMRNLP